MLGLPGVRDRHMAQRARIPMTCPGTILKTFTRLLWRSSHRITLTHSPRCAIGRDTRSEQLRATGD